MLMRQLHILFGSKKKASLSSLVVAERNEMVVILRPLKRRSMSRMNHFSGSHRLESAGSRMGWEVGSVGVGERIWQNRDLSPFCSVQSSLIRFSNLMTSLKSSIPMGILRLMPSPHRAEYIIGTLPIAGAGLVPPWQILCLQSLGV